MDFFLNLNPIIYFLIEYNSKWWFIFDDKFIAQEKMHGFPDVRQCIVAPGNPFFGSKSYACVSRLKKQYTKNKRFVCVCFLCGAGCKCDILKSALADGAMHQGPDSACGKILVHRTFVSICCCAFILHVIMFVLSMHVPKEMRYFVVCQIRMYR